MISQPKNRVQAIKSKFESLNHDSEQLIVRKKTSKISFTDHLCKQSIEDEATDLYSKNECKNYDEAGSYNKENTCENLTVKPTLSSDKTQHVPSVSVSKEWSPKPNVSYLYSKSDTKNATSDSKTSLTRQISDPGRKLHRSHAFRCDRSQIIGNSPKRHGSCNGRSETSDFSVKIGEKKLSKERLKMLGNFLEDQMKKENFSPTRQLDEVIVGEIRVTPTTFCSIPDNEVPKHILEQYAKVVKPKKEDSESKHDTMTDSGVSSETENLDDDKSNKVQKLKSQFEKIESEPEIAHKIKESEPEMVHKSKEYEPDIVHKPKELELAMVHKPKESEPEIEQKTNLKLMDDLCISSETMKLEKKNPHLILTDTLKKALKQPLPPGPPPQKPPRLLHMTTIAETCDVKKKDTKKMLEKLEEVLEKREAQNRVKNIYDIAETNLSVKKPKEMHYLCTEILNITKRNSLTSQNTADCMPNCFAPLKCAIVTNNSVASLPYTRFSNGINSNRSSVKLCCSCSNDSLNKLGPRLSTFLSDNVKCLKCQINDERHNNFKCHLNCKCKVSNCAFYLDEPIYDEPYEASEKIIRNSQYGTINSLKLRGSHSKSLEDLRINTNSEDQKIYDIPCEVPLSPSPVPASSSPKTDFEKLRQNFENGDAFNAPSKTQYQSKFKISKSTENLSDNFKLAKKSVETKFATETKRYRKFDKSQEHLSRLSVPRKDNSQLDVDRENLNRLMNEIYDTVTAACNMEQNRPGSFPTEHSDGSTSEESVKLTRSLTEKRKNYVRRVSSKVAYLDPKNIKRHRHQTSICSYKSEIVDNKQYSTFRSWKSFRASQSQHNLNQSKMVDRRESTDSKFNLTDSRGNILSMRNDFSASVDTIDNLSIDEKAGCVDIELPFEPRERGLFNICLLAGLNYMTGEAYVKSVFPSQVQVPPHIENLIFPETLSSASRGEWTPEVKSAQCYSLVLTDERGERSYGYCRRVLPEGATTCLPLCYCLIGKYRAPGFYYKVLQEIESHHGSSEVEIASILEQLFDTDFPNPGEAIRITHTNTRTDIVLDRSRNSTDFGDFSKSKTMPNTRSDRSDDFGKDVPGNILPEYYDLENNNGLKMVMLSLERTKSIKRPIEPRVDEDNLSVLLDLLGTGLVIKVFSSLLLERKVIIISDKLSTVSSCMEALQAVLYPFVWQQPLISTVPAEIQRDVLEAPLPILAGVLKTGNDVDPTGVTFEEGMLIDLTHPSKVLFYQGDESTILPTSSYKTLKTSLQMESIKQTGRQEDKMTRNVLISEAFLRFFVDILSDFWKYFSVGDLKEGDLGKEDVVFDKESFIKNTSSKQNQYFLEWFTETAMFNHFIQNMAVCHRNHKQSEKNYESPPDLVDSPLPNFYELFEERIRSRSQTSQKNIEAKSNYKSVVNKRVKILKSKLRDLIA